MLEVCRSRPWPEEAAEDEDLWERLVELLKTHQVTAEWRPARGGHPETVRCYELAVAAIHSVEEVVGDEGIICPACGYNLSGNGVGRCSECGEPFDRFELLYRKWIRRPWGGLERRARLHSVVVASGAVVSTKRDSRGWGVVVRNLTTRRRTELSGYDTFASLRRMELEACVAGLRTVVCASRVRVVTGNSTVARGMGLLRMWRPEEWKGSMALDFDLWRLLVDAGHRHELTGEWVPESGAHPERRRAQELAADACRGRREPLSSRACQRPDEHDGINPISG